MTLITRCPACTTMFKVVPDQLRVSEGWVRCGQCDEVFDANAHMQANADTEPILPPSPAVIAPPPAYDWGPGFDEVATPQPILPSETTVDSPVLVDASISSSESAEITAVTSGDREIDLSGIIPAADLSAFPDAELASDDSPQLGKPSEVDIDLIRESPPTFLRNNPGTSSSKHRGWKLIFCTVAIFLMGGLCVQIVVQERDRIVATDPATQPFLEALCSALGCQIAPLRQIESVVIESSSFANVRPDIYRLSVTLKNTAQLDVALPAVELTLTDMQDQTVVRRVLTATELGAKQKHLVADGEWGGSRLVQVTLPASAERVSGYRLLTFYP